MGCEESFITMKLIWHSYLVSSLVNCAHETPTETDLNDLTDDAVVKCAVRQVWLVLIKLLVDRVFVFISCPQLITS